MHLIISNIWSGGNSSSNCVINAESKKEAPALWTPGRVAQVTELGQDQRLQDSLPCVSLTDSEGGKGAEALTQLINATLQPTSLDNTWVRKEKKKMWMQLQQYKQNPTKFERKLRFFD